MAWERIVGCSIREPGDSEWRDVHYGAEGIPEVVTNLRTTATVVIIWENWFDDANTRRDVARALRTVMCGRESIHPADNCPASTIFAGPVASFRNVTETLALGVRPSQC